MFKKIDQKLGKFITIFGTLYILIGLVIYLIYQYTTEIPMVGKQGKVFLLLWPWFLYFYFKEGRL